MIKTYDTMRDLGLKSSNRLGDIFEFVREFNETFKVELNEKPTTLTMDEFKLRHKLQAEELSEYLEACEAGDKVEILDALVDQMYILVGTIQKHGMESIFLDSFTEVHRSNMSKLGEDGKPIFRADGKVMKGSNYKKPDLTKFL